jgi:rubrerythrin
MKDKFKPDGVYVLEGWMLNNIRNHAWKATRLSEVDVFDVANAVDVNLDHAAEYQVANCGYCGHEFLYSKTFDHCPNCGAH